MRLKATREVFEFEDPSGYNFTVIAEREVHHSGRDLGWCATVTMRTTGFKSSEAAIKHLALSAAEFLRQVKKLEAK